MTYWIFGWHACNAAFNNQNRKIEKILLDKKQDPKKLNLSRKVSTELVDTKVIDQKVGKDSVHQGIAALVHELIGEDLSVLANIEQATIVILDQVTDPHNTGAIWRSAAAFGASAIVTTERNSAPESGVLAKAASGALEMLPRIEVKNLASAIAELKEMGFWVYGLSEHAKEELSKFKFAKKTAFVFGSEGDGMRSLTTKSCDQTLKLNTHDSFQTLNVSNAAAVVLYEVFRQNHN